MIRAHANPSALLFTTNPFRPLFPPHITGMRLFSDLMAQARTGSPHIPDDWKQGRTAYGGLSAAFLLEKVRFDFPDLPPLRSVIVNFTGPVTDHPILSTAVLRQGRNVTTAYATAEIDGHIVCTATFSFGASRDSTIRVDAMADDVPIPDQVPSFFPPGTEKFAPAFTRHFETKLIEGGRPMSGAERGYIRCWCRHRDTQAQSGEAALLAIGDMLPPAALPMLKHFAPVSSMTWMCNFLGHTDTEDGWYMLDSDLTAARDGYSSQVMRIWNRRGELIADGMQSVTIFA